MPSIGIEHLLYIVRMPSPARRSVGEPRENTHHSHELSSTPQCPRHGGGPWRRVKVPRRIREKGFFCYTLLVMTIFSKLKQFKDLRDQAKGLRDTLSKETVHAEALAGKIHVIMDGNQDIVALDIDESLFSPEQKKNVEAGVREAISSAIKKVHRIMADKFKASGLNLPGMGSGT